ncbi:MAG: RNA polymerase sigma-70 factor [Bacteroidota bacterium]
MFLSKRKKASDELVIQTAEGFTKFYETYLQYVYSIAYRYLKNKTESEEITSKIFTSLWERRKELSISLEDETSWRSYLSKAVRLSVYNFCRNREIAESHLTVVAKSFRNHENTTEKELAFDELSEQVRLLVDQLSPKCKQVYLLSRNGGLTNKEIAEKLSISHHAVKKHIAKALNYLRDRLTDYQIPKRAAGT